MELTITSVTAYRSPKYEKSCLKCWTSKKERDALNKVLYFEHKSRQYVYVSM